MSEEAVRRLTKLTSSTTKWWRHISSTRLPSHFEFDLTCRSLNLFFSMSFLRGNVLDDVLASEKTVPIEAEPTARTDYEISLAEQWRHKRELRCVSR